MTYDDRETVCQKGKFRLEEWEDVNYCEHCFYNDDEPLGDGDVVLLLAKVTEENEELKKENKAFEHHLSELQGENEILTKENEKLKERVKQLQINNTQRLQNEIEMLKTTIARNEAYIETMQHIGPWKK